MRFEFGLIEESDLLAFNREHAFLGRKKSARAGHKAGVDIESHVRTRSGFLLFEFLGFRFVVSDGGGFCLLRGGPVDHGRGDLFPVTTLKTEVANAVTLARVFPDELIVAV